MRDQRQKDGTRNTYQIGGIDRSTRIAAATTSRPAPSRQYLDVIEVEINPAESDDIQIQVSNLYNKVKGSLSVYLCVCCVTKDLTNH